MTWIRLLWLGLGILAFSNGCTPPPPRITTTTMGTAVQAGKIVSPTTTFKPGDHMLYVVVETENVLGGIPLGVKWYALNGAQPQLLLETEVQLDPLNTSGEFGLTSTGDLAVGKYQVVVYLNGKEDRTVNFEVK